MLIVNAENQILGRIASRIAKSLLKGEEVYVINAEKAVISGNPDFIKKFYLKRRHRGDPIKGPFFPKYPDRIFRRTVRGMLPMKKAKGREAFKRLKVFIGVPDELKNKIEKAVRFEDSDVKKLKCKYISLGELSLYLGAKKKW